MGYLDDLIAQAQSASSHFGIGDPDRTDAVKHDRYDTNDWNRVRDQVPALGAHIDQMKMKHHYVDDFYEDFFHLTHKADPELRDPHDMRDTHLNNLEILDAMDNTAEFQRLRQWTVGDATSSVSAMTAMNDVVTKVFEEVEERNAAAMAAATKAQEDAEKALQELQDAADSAAMMPAPPEGMTTGTEQALQDALDQFNSTREQRREAMEKAQQQTEQTIAENRAAVRNAANEAAAQAQADADLANGFGLQDSEEFQKMNVQERLALMEQLRNNRLAEFAKLIGQFRMVQQAESRRRIKHASTEIHGVTFSDDFTRLTPGEYLNFADPSLETLMLSRWAEAQLLTYDVRGNEKQGKGPIVVVCDESGSMNTRDVAGGTREAWSKAFALALCDQARQQGRDFHYIGFSGPGNQFKASFPGGKTTIQGVIAMTEHFFGGGTSYRQPLEMALSLIIEAYENRNLPRPDVVFITDDTGGGLAKDFLDYWRATKHKLDVRCYGIAIGCSVGQALDEVSDDVREITELASDPRVMVDVFRTV